MQQHFNVLIVDDKIDNIKVAMAILEKENYHVFFATSGKQALQMVKTEPQYYDFILLDVMMPEMDGFQTCQRLKSHPATKDIPVIFVTAKTDGESIGRAYSVGGIDYVSKPYYATELLMKLKTHLSLIQARTLLKHKNIDLAQKLSHEKAQHLIQLEQSQKEIMRILTNLIDFSEADVTRNRYLITELAVAFAEHLPEMSENDIDTLKQATQLYDIGKLKKLIPYKKYKTEASFDYYIKSVEHEYPNIGYDILRTAKTDIFQKIAIVARQHKENWDGSGYPHGLEADDIHIYARIVGLSVGLYESMYPITGENKSFEKALAHIQHMRGFKYDPILVNILTEHQDRFKNILNVTQYQ